MTQYNDLFKEHYTELERLRQVERDYAAFHGATIELLLHIEFVIDAPNWEKIGVDMWNAVSTTTLNKQGE